MNTKMIMEKLKCMQNELKFHSIPISTVLDKEKIRYDEDMADPVVVHGTGFVLRIGGRDFLFSAKHVIEDAHLKSTPLYYPGKEGKFEQLEYNSNIYQTQDSGDKIDIAFVEIRHESLGSPFTHIDITNDLFCHPVDLDFKEIFSNVVYEIFCKIFVPFRFLIFRRL